MADATTPKTPLQSKSQPLAPDTVPIPRSTSQFPYRTGDLKLGREAVLDDLGRYLEVPYNTLVQSLFGPSPDIVQIRQRLLDRSVLLAADNDAFRWTQFPDTPDVSRDAEDVVFQPFIDIVSIIFQQGPSDNVSYHAAPSRTPLSQRRNTSHPDAYITYKRPDLDRTQCSDETHWWDIAIPFEFKKKDDDNARVDNTRKILWSLHNIMRKDPCRRFVLGITIEDTKMRVWSHNRAYVAVSKPLDFMEAINDVISLFYLTACMDDERLGWDPTMERILDEHGKVQYKFKVGDEIYTTVREIATYGADPMVSRGSRVYEVKDQNGDVFTIKDSWRDRDRDTEGAIVENIFKDIRRELGDEEAEKAEKCFVRVRVSENVMVSDRLDGTLVIKGHEDGKLVVEGEEEDGLKWICTPKSELSQRPHLPSTGHIPPSNEPPQIMRYMVGSDDQVPQRIHTRTVFMDVGVALMNVRSLLDCFTCLSGALKALDYLHQVGWVHRDVSASNMLWFPGDRIGKLSDLEYAKKVNSEGAHDVRTGTMQYMAVEVEHMKYVFIPRDTSTNFDEPCIDELPFCMNFLHDLESEWWTAVWVLFYHTDTMAPPKNVDEQLQYFNEAFPSTVASPLRRYFFEHFHQRRKAWEALSGTYKMRCSSIAELGSYLVKCYETLERSFPQLLPGEEREELRKEAHTKAREYHQKIVEDLGQSKDILLQPLHRLRRKRDQPDDSPTRTEMKRSKLA